jgi:hypothetical protein
MLLNSGLLSIKSGNDLGDDSMALLDDLCFTRMQHLNLAGLLFSLSLLVVLII